MERGRRLDLGAVGECDRAPPVDLGVDSPFQETFTTRSPMDSYCSAIIP
jgi:hypothetical protein